MMARGNASNGNGLATQNGNGTAIAEPVVREVGFLAKLDRSRDQIARLLPDPSRVDRVVRVARTAYQMNADIRNCSDDSILASVMKACELGLEPGGAKKEAHLVPFGKECVLIIGYAGFITLAERANVFRAIETRAIHEKDDIELIYTPEAEFTHRPFFGGESGKLTHVYAYARKTNGALIFEIMTRAEIEAVKSACRVGPAWKNYYDEMSRKVVLKRMLKRQPCSVELVEAIEHDNSIYDVDALASGQQPKQLTAGRGTAALMSRLAEPEPEFTTSEGVANPLRSESDELPPGEGTYVTDDE